MIVCPNCNHQNPDGAVQCEACYTPLPAMTSCPNCGAAVQTDASFCGQCGFNLRAVGVSPVVPTPIGAAADLPLPEEGLPPEPSPSLTSQSLAPIEPAPASAEQTMQPSIPQRVGGIESRTQLQQQSAQLLHVQTNTKLELPSNLTVIHLGKPNTQVPPDVDVSGFPNSEIVSRIHADIRVEGDAFYIEDLGSSNGTYINNVPLLPGNRHRLRAGDRIALGKGDKVTFLFILT